MEGEKSEKSEKNVCDRGLRLPSKYMLILCYMRTKWQQLDALLKNPVALKVLLWSGGRLVSPQILTSSSFSLVEETHGSLGQCVSFSLIDVGNVFCCLCSFSFFLFFQGLQRSATTCLLIECEQFMKERGNYLLKKVGTSKFSYNGSDLQPDGSAAGLAGHCQQVK